MSAGDWKYFVGHAKTSVLGKFGKHVTRLVDTERNERTRKGGKQ
jgi:hypothetical protein